MKFKIDLTQDEVNVVKWSLFNNMKERANELKDVDSIIDIYNKFDEEKAIKTFEEKGKC